MSKPAIVTDFRFDTETEVGVLTATPNDKGGFDIDCDMDSGEFSTADLFMASEFFRRLAEASVEKNDGK